MAKKITVASYDIDIGSIEKKISELRAGLNADTLGEGLTKKLSKEISQLETQLDKVKNAYPGAGASQRQIDSYNKKMENLRISISSFGKGAIDSFDDSDNYIKKNIKSLQDYINKVSEADKELKKLKEGQEVPKLNVSTNIGKAEEAEKTMRAAAKKGNRQGVLNAYATYSSVQNAELRNLAKTEGKDSEKYQITLRDREHVHEIEKAYVKMAEAVLKADQALEQAKKKEANAILEARNAQKSAFSETITGANAAEDAVKGCQVQIDQWAQATKEADEASKRFTDIESRIKNLFSAGMAIQTIQRIVRNAMKDFQELDKQFNEIAIVSDYSTQEMWKSFSTVNKVAQEFGVTTKNVLEVQNLYYHQGKDMAEVNKLTAQTLTLAKITGMDYERATSDLTAALNAYNIAAEDSVRVTDTIAAMDTNAAISSEELMTALTKTASIAANAGMSLESTEVFLTKMIETTREAPENLGTALKTIIARFGEVKQEIDGEEIELADINRVDTALKSIGISLLDTAGQIRDLDDVFMELSSKWDDLDRNTQRYIATQAAGSRQQSRFIAMMEDYDRTLELTEIAQDSAGIGARQLAESMDSMETSINRLKSTWQEFYASLISAGAIKGIIDIANGFLTVLNKLPAPLNLVAAGLMLWGAKVLIVDKGLKALGAVMGQEIAAASGAAASIELMVASMSDAEIALKLESKALSENTKQLLLNEQAARQNAETKKENSKKDMLNTFEKEGWTKDGRLTERGKDRLKRKKEAQKRRNESDYKEENKRYNFDFKVKEPVVDAKKTLKQIFDQAKKRQTAYNGIWKNILKKQWGKDGLKNSFTSMKNAFSTKGGIGALAKGKVMGVLTKAMPILTKIAATLPKIITFITQLINPITVLIAVTTGAFALYRREMGQTLDDTKNIEKLEKAQEKYNNSLKEYNNLQENAKTYEKYRNRKNLSEEELQEQQDAAKALVDEYPSLLNSIDEEGKYHLKNAEEIQKEISAKEELLDISAKQYAQLRVKNAQVGIYTDENTKAGQSMKNLQDYADTLEKDTLKKLARRVDKTLNFNKSRYYDAMEAYASGEKSSFGYKEFSDWFAGDIGKNSWEKLLTYIEEGVTIQGELTKVIDDNGDINEEALKLALGQTGAYGENNIDKVAETFIALNDQMGGILGSLLEGAAQEYSEIEIMQASLVINKADFQWDAGANLTEAMSAAAKERAEARTGYKNASEEKKAEIVKEEAGLIADSWEEITKLTGQKVEKVFSDEAMGSLTFAKVGTFNTDAGTDKAKREAVLSFYNELEDSLQILPEGFIENSTQEVIDVLFERIKKGIQGADEKSRDNIWSDYETSANMYKKGNFNIDKTSFDKMIDSMSVDQVNALQEKMASLSMEQQAPYLSALMSGRSKIKDLEQQNDFINKLLKIDLTDIDSLVAVMQDAELSIDNCSEAIAWFISAMGGVDAILFKDLEEGAEKLQKRIEKLTSSLEKISKLEAGEGGISEITAMLKHLDSIGQLEDYDDVKAFVSGLTWTNEGAKYVGDSGKTYVDSALDATGIEVGTAYNTIEDLEEKKRQGYKLTAQEQEQYENAIQTAALGTAGIETVLYEEWKARQEGIVKGLQKEVDKLKKVRDAYADLVEFIRKYDYYQNLDRQLEQLGMADEKFEFEIEFSTNEDVIADNLTNRVNTINNEIAANLAGQRAADENALMYRDSIEKNYGNYASFDSDGTIIVNQEKMFALQQKITAARVAGRTEEAALLEEEKKGIEASIQAYTEAQKKSNDYAKDVRENFKDLETVLDSAYQSRAKAEEKIYEIIKDKEDKELDNLKKKYDAMKKENADYLDSVRKMVDKERQIRDRQNREQDVADKEKKLAMMKMDTSGVYKNQIQQLEKELAQDYQDLEDDAIDSRINDIEEEHNRQTEIWDKEVEYLENSLEEKRKHYSNYQAEVNEILMKGSDAATAWIIANDEKFLAETQSNQILLRKDYQKTMADAVAANEFIGSSLIEKVSRNLERCRDSAKVFEDAAIQYGVSTTASNDGVSKTVKNLSNDYYALTGKVEGLDEAEDNLRDAIGDVENASNELNSTLQENYNLEHDRVWKLIEDYKELARQMQNTNELKEKDNSPTGTASFYSVQNKKFGNTVSVYDPNNYKGTGNTKTDASTDRVFYEFYYTEPGENTPSQTVWFREDDVKENGEVRRGAWWYKYATGGFAYETGPAWLDGTRSKPEAVLNPAQTKTFIQFTNVLDSIFSEAKMPKTHQAITQAKEAIYNFTIKVDQMASDYDVDKLVDRIQEKMVKDSQYRNVTILKKRN